jgi:LmbE family N-acetylglucosaminyl deacetylase
MRNLIISPHADDEVLGCSSVLDRDTFVFYLGVNEFHRVTKEERRKEIGRVAEHYGFEYYIAEQPVDNYPFQGVLDGIGVLIDQQQPDAIYIPYASYNQDHQTVFNAAFSAVRHHDENFFVKKVLVYEQVHNNLWNETQFQPNYFRGVDIEKKLNGYMLHASQVRGHRSRNHVFTLARWRGLQCGKPYAEGFRILRWVD